MGQVSGPTGPDSDDQVKMASPEQVTEMIRTSTTVMIEMPMAIFDAKFVYSAEMPAHVVPIAETERAVALCGVDVTDTKWTAISVMVLPGDPICTVCFVSYTKANPWVTDGSPEKELRKLLKVRDIPAADRARMEDLQVLTYDQWLERNNA
jgi:hypothetical protein